VISIRRNAWWIHPNGKTMQVKDEVTGARLRMPRRFDIPLRDQFEFMERKLREVIREGAGKSDRG
jgi:hypothetical protein